MSETWDEVGWTADLLRLVEAKGRTICFAGAIRALHQVNKLSDLFSREKYSV
jgi:hypothetical protein